MQWIIFGLVQAAIVLIAYSLGFNSAVSKVSKIWTTWLVHFCKINQLDITKINLGMESWLK